ncbi:MAG: DUF3137 domain-containing protein [Coprococcus sp.]
MNGSNNINQFGDEVDDGYNATINQRAASYNSQNNERRHRSRSKRHNNKIFKGLLIFLAVLVGQQIVFNSMFGIEMGVTDIFGNIFDMVVIFFSNLAKSLDTASWPNMAGVVVFITMFVVFILSRTIKKKKSAADTDVHNAIYSELVPRMVTETFGAESVFSHGEGLPLDEMLRLNCFKNRQINIRGRDYISGIYKNVPFSCGYECMDYEYEEKDEEGETIIKTAPLFRGIIVAVEFRKKSSSPLGLCPNSFKDIEKNSKAEQWKMDFNLNKTENDMFNTMFSIRSTDEENLFYILSPEVMERIIVLYGKTVSFGTSYTNRLWNCGEQGINICFDEEKMYIAFNSNASYMNYGFVASGSAELNKYRQQVMNDLQAIEQALDLALEI